jgi:hypothetical protein
VGGDCEGIGSGEAQHVPFRGATVYSCVAQAAAAARCTQVYYSSLIDLSLSTSDSTAVPYSYAAARHAAS